MGQAGRIRIGIDIGGTFTDLQILDEASGALNSLKTATTPEDPSIGLMAGIAQAAQQFGFEIADIGFLLHGTTIATNAVLERKLARGVLLATAGFRDVLEIGRHARRDVYGLKPHVQAALIPRDRRVGVAERMRADGSVEHALQPEAIAAAVAAVRRLDAETVAVSLLNANVNPAHERQLRDGILAAVPDLPVSLSSEVSPEIREYERSSTTVLNALLIPVVRSYLIRLQGRMQEHGMAARLLLVQSNGGVCSAEIASAQPVRLLLSGPSGGALAARRASHRLGLPDLVGIDMGGTSFDVCVVREGDVTLMTQGEIDGLPVRLPMVEIRTIGAGGGSIAAVQPGGRLVVGPRSAGARPGPVCYGKGGTQPTVTDANLVLGRLDADFFLGGAMTLDGPGARAAIQASVGDALALDTDRAAEGMLTLTNASLASAIRLSLFEKGLDPRAFSLLSFGGAGGLHAIPVAAELGITRVIFPADASTFSASGILHSDIVHDLASSRILRAVPDSLAEIAQACAALRRQGEGLLDQDGLPADRRAFSLAADMRYHGQAFELVVPWGDVVPGPASMAALLAGFHALHQQRFSYANPDDPVEIVTLRLTATGLLSAARAGRPAPGQAGQRRGDRRVFVDGAWREVPVHHRDTVRQPIAGPALIEEAYTTVFVDAGWSCGPGEDGDLVAQRLHDRASTAGTGTETLGPIELEITRNAFTAAAAEMDVTVWRTSRSTIVRELLDYSTAVFDRDGYNVAQSARIPQHLNSMGAGLLTVVRDFLPLDQWEDGDVVITNDPYCGGQHIPDILAFRPVFVDGRRIAIVGTLCHHLDMGGIAAGSYGATATEVFQEGLRIPPMKLFRRGVLNAEVLAMMRQNVRRPDMLWGDLQAQLASLAVGEGNMTKLAARYGAPTIVAACARILDSSESAMRAMIARMPDGRYEFEDWLDDDGLTEAPIRIHAAIEIHGDENAAIFHEAVGPLPFAISHSGEFTICKRVARPARA
ncbi:MAG: hypothetical protein NVS2B11_08910 [Acetobacteraceae bacterium]